MINDTGEQSVLLDRVHKGREAEKIKNNPVYAQAKLEAQNRIFTEWVNTQLTQTKEREMLWHDYRAVSRELLALEQIIQQGSMAAMKLKQNDQQE